MSNQFRSPESFWGFLLLGLVVLICVSIGGKANAETMFVSYTVEPSAMLEIITPNLTMPPVSPGTFVDEAVQLLIKSNVNWTLRIVGNQTAQNQAGSMIEVCSRVFVQDYLDSWECISEISPRIIVDHPPTDSDGLVIDVPLRLYADFNDSPGEYQTEIEFTLVPQI